MSNVKGRERVIDRSNDGGGETVVVGLPESPSLAAEWKKKKGEKWKMGMGKRREELILDFRERQRRERFHREERHPSDAMRYGTKQLAGMLILDDNFLFFFF